MIGKQHFTLLYSQVHNLVFMSQNIKSCWSKVELYLFNLNRVLNKIQKLQVEAIASQTANVTTELILHNEILHTSVTCESLTYMQIMIKQRTALNSSHKHCFQKLTNATKKTFINCVILLDKNRLLFEQNNEKTTWLSIRLTVISTVKVITYNNIIKV